jgi:hypothetical protein
MADLSPISGFINAIGTGGTVHFRSNHSPRDGLIRFL